MQQKLKPLTIPITAEKTTMPTGSVTAFNARANGRDCGAVLTKPVVK